jgi:hypothetical protein
MGLGTRIGKSGAGARRSTAATATTGVRGLLMSGDLGRLPARGVLGHRPNRPLALCSLVDLTSFALLLEGTR